MTGNLRRSVLAAALAALVAATLPGTARAVPATHTPPPPPSDARLAAQPARPAVSREQFYLLMPDRFAGGDPSNDRGGMSGDRSRTGFDPTDKDFYQGGDLKGLTKRLDYVKGLGTTAIWLTPVFRNQTVRVRGGKESASYHGYAVTDFTSVDPHFGTDRDLRSLISKAHAKGMKVYFDVITNHTADTITYAEKSYGYRAKGAYPYLDTEGRPFDDSRGMAEVDGDSPPYTPENTGDMVPAWLNDTTMYHNRGDSTFAGESALYGDFYGLDDLWTERPEVVRGMEKIYQKWVDDFDVDGFRVDTAKNVNMEFWTQWATALDRYAAKKGRDDFFLFAEAFSADPAVTAPYLTQGRLDGTLDFPLQSAVRDYASRGGPPSDLATVFAQDYRYATDKTNAYSQVTFLGSHDMGRIGSFIASDHPHASDAELLRRDRLAHEVMFLTRGNPVIYSGDEQGFTGSGADVYGRQTMFASRVADYLDDDEIGTERTHASDAYDVSHPLYRSIAALSTLREKYPALADGAQKELYAKGSVYAFSRTGADREFVVAVNNASEARTVELPVESGASATFRAVYGGAGTKRASGGRIRVTVPALSSLVLRAERRLGEPAAGPSLSLKAPDAGATGTVTLSADPGETAGARVVFAAQVGGGRWRTLGTADHAPYRITQVLPDTVSAGTPLRYKAVVVDRAGRTASALADTTAGQPPAPGKPAAEPRHAVVHYRRADGDYTGLTLRTADGATAAFSGRDAYGAFAWLTPAEGTGRIPFTVARDGVPEGPERVMDFAATGEVWTMENSEAVDSDRPAGAYPPQDTTKAVIHYHRPDGDYDGWGLHTWTGAAKETDWTKPLQPTGKDPYGITFEVPLAGGATSLSYVVHNGDHKDTPGDRSLDLATYGGEVWLTAGESGYLLPSVGAAPEDLDLTKARAQWIDAATVALPASVNAETAASTQLVYSRNGGITVKDGALSSEGRWLRLSPSSLTDAQKARYPHLKGYTAFTVDPRDRDRVRDALTGQVVLTQRLASGALTTATGVQTQGVLDDLYAAKAQRTALGPVFTGRTVTLSVWAPTAHQVTLDIGGKAVAMRRDAASGVWSATGPAAAWRGKPYRYAVKVWAPSVGKVVTNKVTDPYSVALTANSARSLVADLADPALAPKGWSDLRKPKAVAMKDAQIQELHIRDFSAADSTTPKDDRGTYRAFTDRDSAGSKHLRELAASGTSYVHLLPAFDIASIPERKSEQATPECDLTAFAPDSDQQQRCVTKTAPKDAYNWGYDPLHYTVPEGSYASDPYGTRRTVEFRQMVQSLNKDGLRVVMDVVYNHTAAAGQDDNSVLDTIVPGYYQRLNADGSVANSTCCANTAPENTMMGKLVVDSVVTWARQYKVDGFRFDLMGHHPKANMLAVRRALDELTLAKDGVEGKKIILYGEGWNFGEVADDARFEQATQKNMAGTGIATFSDRARDAVRGGAPFDEDPGVQGFASGLYTDPNDSQANGTPAEQKARLLHYQDLIKVGLSGNLADYTFTDTAGRKVRGAQVDYGGAPAGYAQAPGDALAYADAHDNESLYDALAYKLPKRTPATDRARMQVLALATATLSQGPALSQAGSDLLRSKSLDRNSFDSGDWFNAIRWDCRAGNGFGLGLPPAADNEAKWPYAKALLSSVKVPDCTRIHGASAAYQDLLRIRAAEPAFHLGTAAQVQRQLSFPLSGTDETPGVITMRLGDLVVVMNATPERQEQTVGELAGTAYRLHPTQAKGADPVVKRSSYAVKSGTFTVPARTVAVFTH
ncbi:1,4-alpha-glucan branching enzyme [Streptomyces hygroscopicus subsp. sporocinereus]|uniref:1,4-alpha-D-glucan glucanohydrolase n=1 Tax=Streptomyces hygroscopicus TaxID=1912 RepID=A0ABQ3TTX9_STRHY|nr:1,4-alpha-glucan branching enzyme [Streptomyces hygroscopicus]